MNYSPPSKCAVCQAELNITRLSCPHCRAELSGTFSPCRYCSLGDRHRLFLDAFLKCRGNIREVERTLSISYPTVKGLLDELLSALFPSEGTGPAPALTVPQVLDMLERKEIGADEAARLLGEINT